MAGTGDSIRALAAEAEAIDDRRHWIYRASTEAQSGSATDFVIRNTHDGDIGVSRQISADSALSGSITQNVTVDTSGSKASVLATEVTNPRKTDDPIRVETSGSYSGGSGSLPVELPGGDKKGGGAGPSTGASFIMTSGTNLQYNLQSDSNDNTVSVEFRVFTL